jgi:hypothetical protein
MGETKLSSAAMKTVCREGKNGEMELSQWQECRLENTGARKSSEKG